MNKEEVKAFKRRNIIELESNKGIIIASYDTDEEKIEDIKKFGIEDEYDLTTIIKSMKNDDIKLNLINEYNINNKAYLAEIISSVKNDDIKYELLQKYNIEEIDNLTLVAKSMNSDDNKFVLLEKVDNIYKRSEIIASMDNESIKIEELEKKELGLYSKTDIILSIKPKDKAIELFKKYIYKAPSFEEFEDDFIKNQYKPGMSKYDIERAYQDKIFSLDEEIGEVQEYFNKKLEELTYNNKSLYGKNEQIVEMIEKIKEEDPEYKNATEEEHSKNMEKLINLIEMLTSDELKEKYMREVTDNQSVEYILEHYVVSDFEGDEYCEGAKDAAEYRYDELDYINKKNKARIIASFEDDEKKAEKIKEYSNSTKNNNDEINPNSELEELNSIDLNLSDDIEELNNKKKQLLIESIKQKIELKKKLEKEIQDLQSEIDILNDENR